MARTHHELKDKLSIITAHNSLEFDYTIAFWIEADEPPPAPLPEIEVTDILWRVNRNSSDVWEPMPQAIVELLGLDTPDDNLAHAMYEAAQRDG